MRYFTNRDMPLSVDHVMALAAFPPGFPSVQVSPPPTSGDEPRKSPHKAGTLRPSRAARYNMQPPDVHAEGTEAVGQLPNPLDQANEDLFKKEGLL
jgi:hypothetical protein